MKLIQEVGHASNMETTRYISSLFAITAVVDRKWGTWLRAACGSWPRSQIEVTAERDWGRVVEWMKGG